MLFDYAEFDKLDRREWFLTIAKEWAFVLTVSVVAVMLVAIGGGVATMHDQGSAWYATFKLAYKVSGCLLIPSVVVFGILVILGSGYAHRWRVNHILARYNRANRKRYEEYLAQELGAERVIIPFRTRASDWLENKKLERHQYKGCMK